MRFILTVLLLGGLVLSLLLLVRRLFPSYDEHNLLRWAKRQHVTILKRTPTTAPLIRRKGFAYRLEVEAQDGSRHEVIVRMGGRIRHRRKDRYMSERWGKSLPAPDSDGHEPDRRPTSF